MKKSFITGIGTLRFLEAVGKTGISVCVHRASSGEIFGMPLKLDDRRYVEIRSRVFPLHRGAVLLGDASQASRNRNEKPWNSVADLTVKVSRDGCWTPGGRSSSLDFRQGPIFAPGCKKPLPSISGREIENLRKK